MIFKFQQGGTTPPFVAYQPVIVSDKRTTATQEEALAAKATKESESGKLSSKDLYTMLKEKLKGLPNDVNIAMNQLQQLEQLTSMDFDGSFTQNIESKYLSTLQTMNQLSFSREQYDKALDNVKSNGGLNEAAIDQYGQVYMTNGKDYKLMSPEKAKQSGWKQMTNQDLLYLRANDPSLSGKDEILNIVNNGIGIDKVTEYIQKCIQGLGASKSEENLYANVNAGTILKGLNDFKQAVAQSGNYDATVQDLYSGKLMTKDSAEQAQQALTYIYRSLPNNMKSLLKTRTKEGTDDEALVMIGQLISSKTFPEKSFELKLEDTALDHQEKSGKGDKDPHSIEGLSMSPVDMLQAGYGQKNDFTIQTAAGASNGIQIPTVQMPITKKGEGIGMASLSDVASSDYAGYLDFSNAFMGDVQIPQAGMQNIAIDGTALYTAYLPLDMQYFNDTGQKRPDIAMLGRYKQAQNEIRQSGTKDPRQINAIYKNHNLPVMYSPNGDILTNYIKFGIVNGTALDNAFGDEAKVADYLSETIDKNTIANTLNILNKGRGEKNKVEYDEKSWWDSISPVFNDYTHVYKGTIFMPINDDYFTYSAAAGSKPTTAQAEMIEARQQAANKTRNYVNPGQL